MSAIYGPNQLSRPAAEDFFSVKWCIYANAFLEWFHRRMRCKDQARTNLGSTKIPFPAAQKRNRAETGYEMGREASEVGRHGRRERAAVELCPSIALRIALLDLNLPPAQRPPSSPRPTLAQRESRIKPTTDGVSDCGRRGRGEGLAATATASHRPDG